MINLITGLPGAGKTLYTLGKVKELAEKESREVYYHGIPNLTLPWILMESPEDWVKLPPKSIIVIDECQSTFRPRAASVKPPLYISEFETHRHKGLDFFLLTQHPMLIDGNIRRLAGKHYHVIRFYGFQKSTVHEFQSVRDNVDKNQKNSISTHFVFPKDVFNWYKSADAHTMKARIPMRMVMLIILPLLLVGAVLYGVKVFKDFRQQPANAMSKLTNAPLTSIDDTTGKAYATDETKQPKLTYAQLHTAILPDFPHTQPVYQKVIEPVRAPYPAACLNSVSKGCTCYTEQGTRMQVSLITCMQIVNNGFYIDWNRESDKQGQSETYVKPLINKQPVEANQNPANLPPPNDYSTNPST